MSTADEVLELRKRYKRAKQQYNLAKSAAPVDSSLNDQRSPVKQKKTRRPRADRARSDKEKANDARLRALTARAKEIRAADPSMKWTAAVQAAAREAKN